MSLMLSECLECVEIGRIQCIPFSRPRRSTSQLYTAGVVSAMEHLFFVACEPCRYYFLTELISEKYAHVLSAITARVLLPMDGSAGLPCARYGQHRPKGSAWLIGVC